MAKPINPYQGPAPAAMAQMGQGIIEAGANIGRTLQSGYESMGKGLASGISSAASSIASAYGDYKKMQSGIKASEKAFDTFRSFLSPEVQQSIDARIEEMNKDTSLSLQDKAAFWDQAKSVMGGAINQKFAIDKQQQEINAKKAMDEANLQNQLNLERLRLKYKAQQGGGINFSADPISGGMGSGGAGYYNQQYGD